jgi:Family of unknown function (DUF6279)
MPHRRLSVPLLFFPLLVLLLALQGCSAVKLAYNQADTVLYWRLDSYVDLNEDQAPRVREGLAQFQQWHRRSQLPAYAALLARVRPQLADAITPTQACLVVEQARDLVEASLDPAQWPLLWLAGDLSEEQLRHIERKQASSDADWKKEWLSGTPERLAETRFEQWLSRTEMLYGSLEEAQKSALRAGLAASSFDPQRQFAERLRRQQDLRQVLRKIRDERLGPEPARAQLKAYLDRALASPDPAYQRYAQTKIREGCAIFARLHNATTPAQRATATQKLKGYEDDLRLLAAQR